MFISTLIQIMSEYLQTGHTLVGPVEWYTDQLMWFLFTWFCLLAKMVTPWPHRAILPGFHLHQQDQVYCLVPQAPQ